MIVSELYNLLPLLHLHGRTIVDEKKCALFFNWTCSGFSVSFKGTMLKAKIGACRGEEYPWIGVVEGFRETIFRRVECHDSGDGDWYDLYEAENDGPHTIRVVKLSENTKGKVGLFALETDGVFIPPEVPVSPLTIEFVGDSITCGFGNEAPDKDSPFLVAEENGWMTFAAIAARELGAAFSCVCVSGISVSAPKHPLFPMKPMDEIYEYTDYLYDTLAETEPQPWSFGENKQDVIVLNLGTNDVNPVRFYKDMDIADEEELHFRRRYKEFVRTLRRLNGPQTLICCVLGPIEYYLYDAIKETVEEYRHESGDMRVCSFKLIGVNLMTEGFGAISHPSMKTHARLGEELAVRLKALLS